MTLVIALHGIGSQRPGWSNRLAEGIQKRAKKTRVRWSEVTYADINAEYTDELWAMMRDQVEADKIRRFVVGSLSDAIRIDDYQHRVFDRLDRALTEAFTGEPVSLISHSLGTVLAARWVVIKQPSGVRQLVTMGSPVPLFPALPAFPSHVSWTNIFDSRDPIGHPISSAKDIMVKNRWRWVPVIGPFEAHANYDVNGDVHEAIVNSLP